MRVGVHGGKWARSTGPVPMVPSVSNPAQPPEPDPTCPSCAVLREQVAELMALVKELQGTVERQAKEIAKLHARIKPTSRNSSTPPSSDPFRPRKPRSGSKRKQGGQPGHEGKGRDLGPPDEVLCEKPHACDRCGTALVGDDPAPHRHQVAEIPEPKVVITEYQLHALTCTCCGHKTRAKLPNGVPQTQFGPNIHAVVATMTGRYRLSKREAQQCMADVHGLAMSLGSISNIERRVSGPLAPAHAEALQDVQDASVKHVDETSWRQQGKSAFVWLAATLNTVVCLIRGSRSSDVAKELIGEQPTGIIVSDRYCGYSFVADEQRQVCWAHLRRDFQKMAEGEKEHRQIGHDLLALTDAMFERWHSFRDGRTQRGELARHSFGIRLKMFALLDRGARSRGHRTPSLCRGILKTEACMWTFVDAPGVEPTNNDAERAVRPAVIYRKSSFGAQSDRGSRFVERMQTVAGTLARRQQNLFGFVRQAAVAALGQGEAPSLRS